MGARGNRGAKAGKRERAIIQGTGHKVACQEVHDSAAVVRCCLEKYVDSLLAEEAYYREHKSGKSDRNMLVLLEAGCMETCCREFDVGISI